jgi:hypothetical protein
MKPRGRRTPILRVTAVLVIFALAAAVYVTLYSTSTAILEKRETLRGSKTVPKPTLIDVFDSPNVNSEYLPKLKPLNALPGPTGTQLSLPFHTLSAPRSRACVSQFNPLPHNFHSCVHVILHLSRSELRCTNGKKALNHLLQTLHRAGYSRCLHYVDRTDGSMHRLLDALKLISDDNSIIVVIQEISIYFTVPGSEIKLRLNHLKSRLLVAGSSTCSMCYCTPDFPNMKSVTQNAGDGRIVYPSSAIIVGYRSEIKRLLEIMASSRVECLDGALATALAQGSSGAAASGAVIDSSSLIVGVIPPSEQVFQASWTYDPSGDHILRQTGSADDVPYPAILYFPGVLDASREDSCGSFTTAMYNRIGLSVTDRGAPPYLLTSAEAYMSVRNQKGRTSRPRRVVVSLTTTPSRLGGVQATIESLLQQDITPGAVYLHVPSIHRVRRWDASSADAVIPAALLDLQRRHPHFIININCTDFGPATKLIPTLELESDPMTIIITVDDDMVFKPGTVSALLRAHLRSPDMAFAYAGQMIDFASVGPVGPAGISVRSVDRNEYKVAPFPVDILEAFMGAVYRRDFFDVDKLKRIPDVCVMTDDIWISSNLALKGIPRVKLIQSIDERPLFSVNDKVSPLRADNIGGASRNDICAAHLLRTHFFPSKQVLGPTGNIFSKSVSAWGTRSSSPLLCGGLTVPDEDSGVETPPEQPSEAQCMCPFEFLPVNLHNSATERSSPIVSPAGIKEWDNEVVILLRAQIGDMRGGNEPLKTCSQFVYPISIIDYQGAEKGSSGETSGHALILEELCENNFAYENLVIASPNLKYFLSFRESVNGIICRYDSRAEYNESVAADKFLRYKNSIKNESVCFRNHHFTSRIDEVIISLRNNQLCIFEDKNVAQTTYSTEGHRSINQNTFPNELQDKSCMVRGIPPNAEYKNKIKSTVFSKFRWHRSNKSEAIKEKHDLVNKDWKSCLVMGNDGFPAIVLSNRRSCRSTSGNLNCNSKFSPEELQEVVLRKMIL